MGEGTILRQALSGDIFKDVRVRSYRQLVPFDASQLTVGATHNLPY